MARDVEPLADVSFDYTLEYISEIFAHVPDGAADAPFRVDDIDAPMSRLEFYTGSVELLTGDVNPEYAALQSSEARAHESRSRK